MLLSNNWQVLVFHNIQGLLKKHLEKQDWFSIIFISCQIATGIQTVLKKNEFNSFLVVQSFWQHWSNVKQVQYNLLYFKFLYETLCHRQLNISQSMQN